MKALFVLLFLLALMTIGCSLGRSNVGGKKIKVTAWNVQTFFDCVEDGCEYDDFVHNKNWNQNAYRARLERLASAMKKMNADVFVLEEIENERVVYDISSFFVSDWNYKRRYRYACFAKSKDGATGCAVFSRFPLEQLSVHGVYVNDGKMKMPSVRPVMQVKVLDGSNSFMLLVNHWKSKKGTDDGSFLREKQEMSLGCLVSALNNQNVLACGDFNRSAQEFSMTANGCVELHCFGKKLYMNECSTSYEAEDSGTYFFRGEWSAIDHIFYCGTMKVSCFNIETEGEWCDLDTHVPYGYKVWTGMGYSDHLPVSCCIEF